MEGNINNRKALNRFVPTTTLTNSGGIDGDSTLPAWAADRLSVPGPSLPQAAAPVLTRHRLTAEQDRQQTNMLLHRQLVDDQQRRQRRQLLTNQAPTALSDPRAMPTPSLTGSTSTPIVHEFHSRQHHSRVEEHELLEPVTIPKEHQCDQCGRQFQYPRNLHSHRKTVHGGHRYRCPLCDQSYTRLGNLRGHVKMAHDIEDEAVLMGLLFPDGSGLDDSASAPVSRHSSSNNSGNSQATPPNHLSNEINEHYRQHQQQLQRTASASNDPFCEQYNLTSALKSPTSTTTDDDQYEHVDIPKDHQCPNCPANFQYRRNLQVHRKTVHGGHRYTCPKCGNGYTRLGNLREHFKLKHSTRLTNQFEIIAGIFDTDQHSRTGTVRTEMSRLEEEQVIKGYTSGSASIHSDTARMTSPSGLNAQSVNPLQPNTDLIRQFGSDAHFLADSSNSVNSLNASAPLISDEISKRRRCQSIQHQLVRTTSQQSYFTNSPKVIIARSGPTSSSVSHLNGYGTQSRMSPNDDRSINDNQSISTDCLFVIGQTHEPDLSNPAFVSFSNPLSGQNPPARNTSSRQSQTEMALGPCPVCDFKSSDAFCVGTHFLDHIRQIQLAGSQIDSTNQNTALDAAT